MKKASDIERMLAHIGDPDMRYQEFETPQDEARARADWSLLDSAAGGRERQSATARSAASAEQVTAPAVVPPPVAPARPTYVEREYVAPPAQPETHVEQSGEARGQLQRVFAKLRGDEAVPQRTETAPVQKRDTPLSQIFKRLS